MPKFEEIFYDFLTDLNNRIQQDLYVDNPEYVEMKEEKDKYCEQLKSLVLPELLDDFVESQAVLRYFELNFCYICGIRDSNKAEEDVVSATGEEISHELSKCEKHKQLQKNVINKEDEIQAVLTAENRGLLNNYIKKWNKFVSLEKHYYYIGGIYDKVRLDKYFKMIKNDLGKFVSLFL